MKPISKRVLGLALTLSVLARADGRPVALNYVLEDGADGCPDERWVRQAVAARLGFDPFQPDADRVIEARIQKARKGLEATLQVTTRQGQRMGRREFTSPTGDCLELASAMELAVAISVDPQYLSRPTPEAKPATPPAETPRAPEPPGPSPLAPVEVPVQLHVRGGPLVAAGIAPGVVPGGVVQVSVRWAQVSLGIEGRADLAGTVSVGGGRVSSSSLLGSVVPCFHFSRFAACGVVSIGAVQVTGEIGQQRRSSSPLVLAGGRFQADIPLSASISLQPFLDLQAVLTRTTILSGEQPVWVTWPLAGVVGLSVDFRFL